MRSHLPPASRAAPDGQPLGPADRAHFERSFGTDLTDVRIRTDQGAAGTARSLGARAYTTGSQIAFAAGQFQPATAPGRRLLAHELAHVVQQRGGSASAARTADVEADAHQSALAAVDGAPATVRSDLSGAVRLSGDIRTMSVSPLYAQGLSATELTEQLHLLDGYLRTVPAESAEHQAAWQNRGVLQSEQVRRLIQGQSQSIIGDTVSMRHLRFQQAVLLSAQHRLAQNQENLAEWRALVERNMSAVDLQTQVLAQSALDWRATAQRTGGMQAYDPWAGTSSPYRRNVYEHQMRGEWRACTGCHEMVRADEQARNEPHTGAAWQSPADRLSGAAGFRPAPVGPFGAVSGTNTARVQAAVDAIRPIVAPLGDQGYRIIPDDVFSLQANLSPAELRTRILAKIDQRRADYAELSANIGAGDINYLQLGPVLQDLLGLADTEVQAAVQADITSEHRWAIVKIGATIILALLSILFPPLALAVATLQFASGMSMFQQGYNYNLGVGANNVFSREQQDSGTGMMMAGAFSMATAAAVFATAAPGALDMAATRAITSSDLAIAQRLAQRALAGPIPEAELLQLQQPGLVGRLGQGWADTRGFQVLYRGQGIPTRQILSPIARSGSVADSQALYNTMKAQGLTDLEIAGYTARFKDLPIGPHMAPPGLQGQPLGGVGIPTTRLPNIAADFAPPPSGVIYVLRVPRGLPVPAAEVGWPMRSALEQEWVVFHQLPNGTVVRVLPGNVVPPLRFDWSPSVGPSLVIPP